MLRQGELRGFKRRRVFYDAYHARWLKREWWLVPVSELEAYYARMIEQGRRGYVARSRYKKGKDSGEPGRL